MSAAQINQLGIMDGLFQNTYGYSFWTSEYVPHAPFAYDFKFTSIDSLVLGGAEKTVAIERDHDLLGRVFFTCVLASLSDVANAYYTEDVGNAMFNEIRLSISGNHDVVKLYPDCEHAMDRLSKGAERRMGKIRGDCESALELIQLAASPQKIWVQFRFWFGEDYGCFLPSVAMHQSPLAIKFTTNSLAKITVGYSGGTVTSSTAVSSAQIVTECVYLDDPERDHFASSSLQYLIQQTQYFPKDPLFTTNNPSMTPVSITGLNHPVQEYIVLFRKASNLDGSVASYASRFNFNGKQLGTYVDEPYLSLTLKVNGNKRWENIDPFMGRVLLPMMHHSVIPAVR
jgi:hypothetical protein